MIIVFSAYCEDQGNIKNSSSSAHLDIDLEVKSIIGSSGLGPYVSDIVVPRQYIEIMLSSNPNKSNITKQ